MRFPTKLHDTLNPVSLSLCSMSQAFQRCYTSFTTLNGYESLSLLHCCAIVPTLRTLRWPRSRPPVSVSVTTSRVSSSGEPTFHVSSTQQRLSSTQQRLPSNCSFPLVERSMTLLAMHRLQLNASWSGAFMLLTFSSTTSKHLFDAYSDMFRTLRCCFHDC